MRIPPRLDRYPAKMVSRLADGLAYEVVENGSMPYATPITVTMSDGTKKRFPRADQIHVSDPTSTYQTIDGGKFQYDFLFDTRMAHGIRVGYDSGYLGELNKSNPNWKDQNGWLSAGIGWIAFPSIKEPVREEKVKFTLVSDWLPGPVAIMFRDKDSSSDSPPYDPHEITSEDNPAIAKATGIFHNSVRKYVIGPAIKPGATTETIRRLAGYWVDLYGLKFL
jgi:hypothetical protein